MEPVERVVSRILLLRGQKTILDEDLAELYGVSTGRFNEQVRRNRDRFPGDFMFQLTNQEVERLRSQIAISIGETGRTGRGGRRYRPHARRVSHHDEAITNIVAAIRELAIPPEPKPRRRIGFIPGD